MVLFGTKKQFVKNLVYKEVALKSLSPENKHRSYCERRRSAAQGSPAALRLWEQLRKAQGTYFSKEEVG